MDESMDDSIFEIVKLFREIANLKFCMSQQQLRKLNLYPGQERIVYYLMKNNGLSQRDLSKMTLKTPATITKMIKRMEKEGLIKIIADESDKRITRLELTDLGMEKIYKIKELEKNTINSMFKGFSDSDLEEDYKLINMIINNIEGE